MPPANAPLPPSVGMPGYEVWDVAHNVLTYQFRAKDAADDTLATPVPVTGFRVSQVSTDFAGGTGTAPARRGILTLKRDDDSYRKPRQDDLVEEPGGRAWRVDGGCDEVAWGTRWRCGVVEEVAANADSA